MNYVFTGMKHCGKSTLGRAWARHLGCPFHDTDDEVMKVYRLRGGRLGTVRQVLAANGREFLMDLEREAMHHLRMDVLSQSEDNVIALGGGVPINAELAWLLHTVGTVVYLRDECEVLYRRVRATGPVPFINGADPRAEFERLFKEREPYYTLYADVTIDLHGLSLAGACRKVIETLAQKRQETESN